jgi:hypothetical protein
MDQLILQIAQLVLSGLGALSSVAPQLVSVFTGGQTLEQVTTALRAQGIAVPIDGGPAGDFKKDLDDRKKHG